MRFGLAIALVCFMLCMDGGIASAASGPPSDLSGVSQYVEMIPTTTGPRPAGTAGKQHPISAGLATSIDKSGGTDAAALKTLVTSSSWGAPGKHKGASSASAPRTKLPLPASSSSKLMVPLPSQQSTTILGSAVTPLVTRGRGLVVLVSALVLLASGAFVRLRRHRA